MRIILFLIMVLVFLFGVPSVFASEELVADFPYTQAGAHIQTEHPSESAAWSAVSQAWNDINTATYITKVSILIYKVGVPNALLRGYIAENSTNNILVESTNTINTTTLTTGGVRYNFTFAGTLQTSIDEDLHFGFYVDDVVLFDTSNYVHCYQTSVNLNYLNGNCYYSSDWQPSRGLDVKIYGDIDNPNPTPTPTVSPSPSPVPSSSVVVSSFVSIPTVYLLFLLVGAVVAVMLGLFKVFEGEDNRPLKLLLVLVGLVLFIVVFMWLVVSLGI